MLRIVSAVIAIALLFTTTAVAHDGGSLTHKAKYLRAKVIRVHGKRAPGRDIIRRGLRDGQAPSKYQKARYVRQLRALLAPTHRPLLSTYPVPPTQPPAGAMTASVHGIGAGGSASPYVNPDCESNGYGDKRNATYRGRYQFDQSTWNAYAPAGYAGVDPADAPPSIQDQAAANVPYDAWPNC